MVARVQIEQVLSSILEMACLALDGRPVRRVAVEAARHDDEILVQIQDSGLGLSDYAQMRLFEPRFMAGEVRAGLGMPICKAIVNAHGGELWVESPAGGGTRFNLSLPAAD
jgi:two-component system sensor kinase FixL